MIIDTVEKVCKRFFMIFAEENEAWIRCKGEWLFVETKIFCVHKKVTMALQLISINRLYFAYIQIIFKVNQMDLASGTEYFLLVGVRD